jgi:hypothetical protein
MTPTKVTMASVIIRGERMVPIVPSAAACRYLWALGEMAYDHEAWASAAEYYGLCTDYAPDDLPDPGLLRRFVQAAAGYPDDVAMSSGISRRVVGAWRAAAENVIEQLGGADAARK